MDSHVLSRGGSPISGVMVSFSDITEAREDRQAQVEDSAHLLAALMQSMTDGMFAEDPDGRLTFMNRAAEQLLGWTAGELLGRVMHEVTHYQREDGSPYPIADWSAAPVRLRGQGTQVSEDVFTRKDGTLLPVAYDAAPLESGHTAGTVVVFRDIRARRSQARHERQELEMLGWVGRVKDALDEGRLVLHAQPIIDLGTGAVISHELLVRMLGPGGTVVAPGRFLPAAERFGLIVEVDRWVMHEAVALAGRGRTVHFNLSGASLGRLGLSMAFAHALEEHRVDPQRLVCEITETALRADPARG